MIVVVVAAEIIVIEICRDTRAGRRPIFFAIGRERVGRESVILAETRRWIGRVPHAALRVQYGQRGPSAVVAVVVLKRGKNRGQLNLCVGLLLLFNIPGSLVVRVALFFGGRQLGGRERALLSARHIAAVGSGGTGHASFVVGTGGECEKGDKENQKVELASS